ncbi:MAG: hypothetical protein HEEMFOPI_00352 [Holosporales bacterium]
MKFMIFALMSFFHLMAVSINSMPPSQDEDKLPTFYEVSVSSRFTLCRSKVNDPEIIYYFSKPQKGKYPIFIFCGGSTSRDDIRSVLYLHLYYLKEIMNLGCGVLTVEQWGIDGNTIDADAFIKHYTRTQRLIDHKMVIKSLIKNPPQNWNGKIILFGASEGGILVTELASEFSDCVIATINWSGAGDWSWREELWAFIKNQKSESPDFLIQEHPIKETLSRECFNLIMDETLQNPTPNKDFLGMTYLYHADAQNFPDIDYTKIKSPYLVVSGALDSFVQSSDDFAKKALQAGVNITYHRIEGMDHFIRKNPRAVAQTFSWLEEILLSLNSDQ